MKYGGTKMKNIKSFKNVSLVSLPLIGASMLRRLLIVLLSVQLLACTSTQVKDDISENNWQGIGEYHGTTGTIEYSLAQLQVLSDKYGNGEVDYSTYRKSYENGLIIYCQPENAIQIGGSGKRYDGVCDHFPHGYKFRRDWELGRDMKSAM